jgi:hypothetical protein
MFNNIKINISIGCNNQINNGVENKINWVKVVSSLFLILKAVQIFFM